MEPQHDPAPQQEPQQEPQEEAAKHVAEAHHLLQALDRLHQHPELDEAIEKLERALQRADDEDGRDAVGPCPAQVVGQFPV